MTIQQEKGQPRLPFWFTKRAVSRQSSVVTLSMYLARSRNPPDSISHIIGNQQGAALVDRHADRPAPGVALGADETAQHLHRLPCRVTARERHEHDVVAALRLAVPRAVLADE